MNTRQLAPLAVAIAAAASILGISAPSHAASHLWVINEVFSNADGTVQFVEMHVPSSAANEHFINNKWVRSVTTGSQHTFTANLPPGSTAFACLLLGTTAFAALPGAPTPHYIIPADFFDVDHDTVKWWSYVTGELVFTSGQLPLDGVTSLSRGGSTGINTPTNFAGESGSVNTNPTAITPGSANEPGFVLHVLLPGNSDASVGLEFALPQAGPAQLMVFDATGRLQRRLFDGRADGLVQLAWDGADESGRGVPNGVYLIRLEAGGRQAVRKIAHVR